MSLKVVHICFILLATALAFGLGMWSLQRDFWLGGVASFAGGVLLVGYLFWFLKKMKRLNP